MKVLIADDEDIERSTLRGILQGEHGIELVEVNNGQDALDVLCERLNPDLCLIDLKMPGIDGMELLRKIRREPLLRRLKVVITTATRDRDTVLALAQLGISGYLLKPYQPDKVLPLVRSLLGSVAANRVERLPAQRDLLSKTLLLVDDESEIRRMIKEIAAAEGWRVVEAGNGEEALAALHEGLLPDLCVTDINMPKLDGFGFLKQLREVPHLANLAVIVISSEHKAQTIRQLAEFKVSGYILKPFVVSKIRDMFRGTAPTPQPKAEEQQSEPKKPETTTTN